MLDIGARLHRDDRRRDDARQTFFVAVDHVDETLVNEAVEALEVAAGELLDVFVHTAANRRLDKVALSTALTRRVCRRL